MVTSHFLERGVNTGRIQGTEGSLEKRGVCGQARERQRKHLSCTCLAAPVQAPRDTQHRFNSSRHHMDWLLITEPGHQNRRGCGHEATRTGWKEAMAQVGRSPLKVTRRDRSTPRGHRGQAPPHLRWHGTVPWSWEDKVEGRVW